jgi:hypothetical protein
MGTTRAIHLLIRAFLVPGLSLAVETRALRQQVAVYQHTVKRPKLRQRDRIFWFWLSQLWANWRSALANCTKALGSCSSPRPEEACSDNGSGRGARSAWPRGRRAGIGLAHARHCTAPCPDRHTLSPGDCRGLVAASGTCDDLAACCAWIVRAWLTWSKLPAGDSASLCHWPLDTSISYPSAVRPTTLTRTRRFLS